VSARFATLFRLESTNEGTFGQISTQSFFAFTGELPWRENIPSISCVPQGTYQAILTFSPRFGRGLYLLGLTSPRSGIRIHPANLMGDRELGLRSQLNGCIALGEKLGWIEGQKAVLVSAPACRRLEEFFGREPFTLEIRGC
jgi:hypothetical protein